MTTQRPEAKATGAPAPSGEPAPDEGSATTAESSATTTAARAFVAEHRSPAADLGRRLADDLDDPGAFVRHAEAGLAEIADPAAEAGLRFVAPGIGRVLGVRNPLLDAGGRAFARELRGVRAGRLVFLADAAGRSEIREVRWLALGILGRIVADEPEQAWQVFRRIAREADDWITVDTMAGHIAPAILREPYRWAELEQLIYSPIRWERRLVGATIASMALGRYKDLRRPDSVARALELIGLQIGDAEPDVQKALGWALRNLTRVDVNSVTAFCLAEAERAGRSADGHRAWVLRDAALKLRPPDAAAVRASLAGARRVPGAPSTSVASKTAAAFISAGSGRPLPETPLT